MLNIEYGSYQKLYDKYGEDFIYDPDMYFNNTYDEKWITSDIARKIIFFPFLICSQKFFVNSSTVCDFHI